jgi:hypothetical protein
LESDDSERRELLEQLRVYLERHYKTRIPQRIRLDRGVHRAARPEGTDWVYRIFPNGRTLELVEGDAGILRIVGEAGLRAEGLATPEPAA